jgi:hypothetical protein
MLHSNFVYLFICLSFFLVILQQSFIPLGGRLNRSNPRQFAYVRLYVQSQKYDFVFSSMLPIQYINSSIAL